MKSGAHIADIVDVFTTEILRSGRRAVRTVQRYLLHRRRIGRVVPQSAELDVLRHLATPSASGALYGVAARVPCDAGSRW